MQDPKVAVIISNYNGASIYYKSKSILYRCLKSLEKTDYKNYITIVTDAHSDDNSKEIVSKFKKVEFIDVGHKAPFSENNNFAIKYAKEKYNPDYYLLLNNDVIITDTGWLRKLIKTAEQYKAGIVGCQLHYPNGNVQHAGIEIGYYGARNIGRGERYIGRYDEIKEVEGVTFAVALISNKVIEKVGLLDEKFVMGFEDVDYCIRTREAGFKIIYNGFVILIHLEGSSSTNSKDEKTRLNSFYYGQKNLLNLIYKHKNLFSFSQKARIMFIYFAGAVFGIENSQKARSIRNLYLKAHPIKRLVLSLKAIFDFLKQRH